MNTPIQYRDIAGFPGYRVGSDGSMWSCHRKGIGGFMAGEWRLMKQTFHDSNRGTGYYCVSLCRAGKRIGCNVHTLVLTAFEGPCPPGMLARHFPDPDTRNNAITNLRWGTPAQNCEDRERQGRTARGEGNANAKLTAMDVHEIRNAAVTRGSITALARHFGVSRTIIWQIRSRKIWKHV